MPSMHSQWCSCESYDVWLIMKLSLSLEPGDIGCGGRGFILAESGRARAVFCFVMSELRPLDPEAGGQSVTRSGPRRMWGPWPWGQLCLVTMITMWGFSSDRHRDNVRYTAQNMRHDTSNWRQSSVDFLFIYFEDNQSCVNHKKLLTRILPFWSSQCPRHLAESTESAGRTLGRFTSFREDAFENFPKYLFCGCLFTCLQSLYLKILQMLQF